jgi:hypothetical protein
MTYSSLFYGVIKEGFGLDDFEMDIKEHKEENPHVI